MKCIKQTMENDRKSCARLVRGRASIDDGADTEDGSVAAGGGERGHRCGQDDTWWRTKDTQTPGAAHTLITARRSSESCSDKDEPVDSSTLAAFRQ